MTEKTYRIGEAAALLNLKSYVLRFWETEFSQLEPGRTEKGQRLYSEENIALLRRIQYLLHEKGLTIEGARKALAESPNFRVPTKGKNVESSDHGKAVKTAEASSSSALNSIDSDDEPELTFEQDNDHTAMGRPLPGIERIKDFMHRNAANPPYITISTTPEKQEAVSNFLYASNKADKVEADGSPAAEMQPKHDNPPVSGHTAVEITARHETAQGLVQSSQAKSIIARQDFLLAEILTGLQELQELLEK